MVNIEELELTLELNNKSCLNCNYFNSWFDIYDQDECEPKDSGECNNKNVIKNKIVGFHTTCKLFNNG